MTLSTADRAVIEAWAGPVTADDEVRVEARLAVLVRAEVVALELLHSRYVARAAGAAQAGLAGDASVTLTSQAQLDALRSVLRSLATYCQGLPGLPAEAAALVTAAASSGRRRFASMAYTVDNSRPG